MILHKISGFFHWIVIYSSKSLYSESITAAMLTLPKKLKHFVHLWICPLLSPLVLSPLSPQNCPEGAIPPTLRSTKQRIHFTYWAPEVSRY